MIDDQEQFADAVRAAGQKVSDAELALAVADAEEKRLVAHIMVRAELSSGAKSNAAQIRAADESRDVYDMRVARGRAKGYLAAAKCEVQAAEMQFKQWQSNMANLRLEKHRIYNS